MYKKGKDKNVFLEALRNSMGMVYEAAKKCKITPQTHYRWLQDDAEYAEQVKEINEANLDLAESKLLQNIKAGNQQAIMYYLNNKGKSRGYNTESETDKQPTPIIINWPQPPTQEQ